MAKKVLRIINRFNLGGPTYNVAYLTSYLPKEYEDDNVNKHLRKIKIAKHRNGPVGDIDLVFLDRLAKFENAATRIFRPNE